MTRQTPATATQLRVAISPLPLRLHRAAALLAGLPTSDVPSFSVHRTGQQWTYRGHTRTVTTDPADDVATLSAAGHRPGDTYPSLDTGPRSWLRLYPSAGGLLVAGAHLLGLPPLLVEGNDVDQARTLVLALADRVAVGDPVDVAFEDLFGRPGKLSPNGATLAIPTLPDAAVGQTVERHLAGTGLHVARLLRDLARFGPCDYAPHDDRHGMVQVRAGQHLLAVPVSFEGGAAQVGLARADVDTGASPPPELLPLPDVLVWAGTHQADGDPVASTVSDPRILGLVSVAESAEEPAVRSPL